MKTLTLGTFVSVSALLAWVLALPHAILILLVAQILDIIAGIVAAWGTSSVSSTVASLGVRKKVFAWIIILLVGILQFELVEYMPYVKVLNYSPMEVAALGFVMVESMSILENADKAGLPLPKWLRKGLASAQEALNGEENE